ncbi:MAG: pilus assembly protein [Chloroflexi bacterium]|nr:pilus assembly protein [Chloroflexota bacterium]
MKFEISRQPKLKIIARKHSTGQSMVEIALTLPLLILIVIVLIDFGIVFASYLSLVNATREGAVFAAMYPQLASSTCGSNPHDLVFSYSGTACAISQDDQSYGGGGGVYTSTVTIWKEYTNRIKNDVFVVVGEQLKASQLADQDILYIDRPVLRNGCGYTAGCPITVTVRYRVHTFTSDMSLPGYGRFGLPNYYEIKYSVGMPIRGF